MGRESFDSTRSHSISKMYSEGRSEFVPAELLRVGDIAGMYYSCGKPTNTLIIYGIGGPRVPDSGELPAKKIIRDYGIDIYVPDYIGFGRSDGEFTPQGCIDTFTRLYDEFTNGCEGRNSYTDTAKPLQYNRIIMVGRSLGGTYVPVLPRFDPRIKELGLIFPVVDSKSQGSIPGEETNKRFIRSMQEDGYHHLYRGVLTPQWKDHLENRDDLSPMDNITYMDGIKLFVGHGKLDDIVHYSKSEEYVRRLQEAFPDQKANFKFEPYPNGKHDDKTSNEAIEDFLKWLGFTKLDE